MNNVLEKGNIIAKIRKGEDLDQIIDYVKSEIYRNGPNSSVVLEIVSYFKLFQPEFFKKYEQEIIATMGLFFKQPKIESLKGSVFEMYHQQLKDEFGNDYTPMQADILRKIRDLQYFSFSAPTSTGKSFVFRHLISECSNDVVVIVPSRALINEYYNRLNNLVDTKAVNILTFVDRINTKHIHRNIFILTPERARELFKNKDWLKIDLILFDEAQLSDEHSVRGLYFDSIVRRALKHFSEAKFVFAHPFIENPEAQLQKNGIETIDTTATYSNYELKNVGQIFYTHDTTNQKFYHFGSNPATLGKRKLEANFDPVESALKKDGSVLIYVPKSHIYSKQIYIQFQRYISMCQPIDDPIATKMIDAKGVYWGFNN
jgi:ATP-dependent RNA helicase DOB1